MTYEIKIQQFEGPFDLLLFFVEKEEINILEISVGQITEEFLKKLQSLQLINIDLGIDFIFVAALLMRLKVQSILPRPIIEAELPNTFEELNRRLFELKRFKLISQDLMGLEYNRCWLHKKGLFLVNNLIIRNKQEENRALMDISLFKLLKAWTNIQNEKNIGNLVSKHSIPNEMYSIHIQKDLILKLLKVNYVFDFHTLTQVSNNRNHLIYNFIALLELLHEGILKIATQQEANDFSVSLK